MWEIKTCNIVRSKQARIRTLEKCPELVMFTLNSRASLTDVAGFVKWLRLMVELGNGGWARLSFGRRFENIRGVGRCLLSDVLDLGCSFNDIWCSAPPTGRAWSGSICFSGE
jgi:hypothetical protein